MKCNYSLVGNSGYRYRTSVTSSFVIEDALAVDVSNTTPDSVISAGHSYVSKHDAIDLAWSILENYGVAERPAEPLAKGDFVVFVNGSVGRIVDIDVNEPALYVEGPSTNPNWHNTHETHRITKEEFVEKASAQAVEQITKFAEQG